MYVEIFLYFCWVVCLPSQQEIRESQETHKYICRRIIRRTFHLVYFLFVYIFLACLLFLHCIFVQGLHLRKKAWKKKQFILNLSQETVSCHPKNEVIPFRHWHTMQPCFSGKWDRSFFIRLFHLVFKSFVAYCELYYKANKQYVSPFMPFCTDSDYKGNVVVALLTSSKRRRYKNVNGCIMCTWW